MASAEGKAEDPGRQDADEKQSPLGPTPLIKMSRTRNQPGQQGSEIAIAQIDNLSVDRDRVVFFRCHGGRYKRDGVVQVKKLERRPLWNKAIHRDR